MNTFFFFLSQALPMFGPQSDIVRVGLAALLLMLPAKAVGLLFQALWPGGRGPPGHLLQPLCAPRPPCPQCPALRAGGRALGLPTAGWGA